MTQRTIDETGKDVPKRRGEYVWEVLFLRPDPDMIRAMEWVASPSEVPKTWYQTPFSRLRIILDNES